jgi:Tol biopolymer transport system component
MRTQWLFRSLFVAGIGLVLSPILGPSLAGAAFTGNDGPIVFVSTRSADTRYCAGPYQGDVLWVIPLPSSTTAEQLTCTGQQDTEPFFSPDGTQVVFASTRNGGNSQLFSVPLSSVSDSAAVTPTLVSVGTDETDTSPSWSPANDGTIVFSRTIGSGTPQLWTENVNNPSGAQAPVFSSPTGYSDTEPVYDPLNSSIIAFVRSIGGDTQIFEYNTSTETFTNLSSVGDGGTAR